MTDLLTPAEIAAVLGVQKSTIYQWTRKKSNTKIPHIKLGGRLIRFQVDEVMAWARKRFGKDLPEVDKRQLDG